jgi:hypothetical protein
MLLVGLNGHNSAGSHGWASEPCSNGLRRTARTGQRRKGTIAEAEPAQRLSQEAETSAGVHLQDDTHVIMHDDIPPAPNPDTPWEHEQDPLDTTLSATGQQAQHVVQGNWSGHIVEGSQAHLVMGADQQLVLARTVPVGEEGDDFPPYRQCSRPQRGHRLHRPGMSGSRLLPSMSACGQVSSTQQVCHQVNTVSALLQGCST